MSASRIRRQSAYLGHGRLLVEAVEGLVLTVPAYDLSLTPTLLLEGR